MPYRHLVNQHQNKTAEIFVYGYIGDEVMAADILTAIRALENVNDKIIFRINSGGGNMFEGLAIFNAIRNCKCATEAMIDGVAASMGSVIPMACNSVQMSKVAMFMTHRASGLMGGNANEMRNYAQLMESMETAVCNIYAAKTGLTCEEARTKYISNEDRWLTAQEALAEKIIDGIYDSESVISAPAAALKDERKLVDFYNESLPQIKFSIDMIKLELTAQQAMAMGFIGTENETAKQAAIDSLVAKAKKTEALELELTEEKAKTIVSETRVKELEDEKRLSLVSGLVDKAIADKKLAAGDREDYIKLATADYDTTEKLIQGMKAHTSIETTLSAGGNTDANAAAVAELMKESGRNLYMSGKLETLRTLSFPDFKIKFKEWAGADYMGES